MADAFQTDGSEQQPDVNVKFEDLVGDNKKYRDPDAVAKAVIAKDEFIEQLKRENAGMRESLSKRETEEQFLDRLKQLSQATPPKTEDNPPPDGARATAVTPETVEEIINRREAEKQKKANLDLAIAKAQEAYGDDYKRHVAKQAQAIGMTTADLTDLASKNPNAFIRVLGLDGTKTNNQTDAFAPPRSSVSVSTQPNPNVKNYAYFQKLRAEKGEAHFYTPSIQMEMWNNLKQMGEEEFYKR